MTLRDFLERSTGSSDSVLIITFGTCGVILAVIIEKREPLKAVSWWGRGRGAEGSSLGLTSKAAGITATAATLPPTGTHHHPLPHRKRHGQPFTCAWSPPHPSPETQNHHHHHRSNRNINQLSPSVPVQPVSPSIISRVGPSSLQRKSRRATANKSRILINPPGRLLSQTSEIARWRCHLHPSDTGVPEKTRIRQPRGQLLMNYPVGPIKFPRQGSS